jgi:hypothetical protein
MKIFWNFVPKIFIWAHEVANWEVLMAHYTTGRCFSTPLLPKPKNSSLIELPLLPHKFFMRICLGGKNSNFLHVHPSVRLTTCISAAFSGQIFINFGGNFYENLYLKSKFIKILDNLNEILCTFYCCRRQ